MLHTEKCYISEGWKERRVEGWKEGGRRFLPPENPDEMGDF
jgi:hypothetical protein